MPLTWGLERGISKRLRTARIAENLSGSGLGVDRINTHAVMSKPKFFEGYPVGEA